MQIWSCTPGEGDAAQHFTLTADRRIQWANTAECLDLTDGSLTSGNQVCFQFYTRAVCLSSDRIFFPSLFTGPDVGLRSRQYQPSMEHLIDVELGCFCRGPWISMSRVYCAFANIHSFMILGIPLDY
jgi:hypothetical protein